MNAQRGKDATVREFDDPTLELVAERFKTLAEPMRLRILNALREGDRTVSQLVEDTEGSQANVSKHLALLLSQGIVSRRKEGVFSYYGISDPSLFQLCELVCQSLESGARGRQAILAGPQAAE